MITIHMRKVMIRNQFYLQSKKDFLANFFKRFNNYFYFGLMLFKLFNHQISDKRNLVPF